MSVDMDHGGEVVFSRTETGSTPALAPSAQQHQAPSALPSFQSREYVLPPIIRSFFFFVQKKA